MLFNKIILLNHLMRQFWLGAIVLLLLILSSCKKLVHIGEPVNTITTSETFSSDANATSALIAIYNDMINNHSVDYVGGYANGTTTMFAGLSSDELNVFSTNTGILQVQQNNILPDNSNTGAYIWSQAYANIYQANTIIEGLNASNSITPSTKNQLLGEAKFLRAFIYFYLVNFFGDVPLITSSSWVNNQLAKRTTSSDVYSQIIADLKDAQSLLGNNYSISGNERIRVNKWAATALLARTYLYTGNWANAESEASNVIGTNLYSLVPLNNIFLKNSQEAIWQLQLNTKLLPYNIVPEAYNIRAYSKTNFPKYYLTNALLGSFEAADQRKISWIDTTKYSGTLYCFPNKYKVGVPQVAPGGNATEYYMMLRLAEQYLIRGEARIQQNKLSSAISDINTIRNRAGLPNYSGPPDNKDSVFAALYHENQIELFAEWGHRWFDLKRWGKSDMVLGNIKGSSWQTTDQFYPIPYSEMLKDPNLEQNPGY